MLRSEANREAAEEKRLDEISQELKDKLKMPNDFEVSVKRTDTAEAASQQ